MNDITVDDIMYANGFVNFDKTKQHESKNISINNIYELLHTKGPHIALKEYGMFDTRSDIPFFHMEYLNYYDLNKSKHCAQYLMSISYNLQKDITNNTCILQYNDISPHCALYYLQILDENGNVIDENNYKIKMQCFNLPLNFVNGYMMNEDPSLYFILSEKKVNILNEMLTKSDVIGKQFLFNEYTDFIEINFDDNIKINKVNVVCKVYNIYGYGGFFMSGWFFNL